MIIRHNLPHRAFTKIDRKVFTNPDLSHGACRLYGYLCGLRNGANYSDKYVCKALDVAQASLTRWKKELKQERLILIDKVGPRIYVVYIGYTGMPASAVKAQWALEEDKSTERPRLEEVA